MKNTDFKALLKRVFELVMPDLRSYYRIVRKAKVVKSYASDGRYWADVQPLRNDDSVDESEPVIPRVEIPVMWGGPERGIVCPPATGTFCDLSYYDGDPNYPRISNFRWHDMKAPAVEIGGLIIQHSPGAFIKIDAEKNIIFVTPADLSEKTGGNKTSDIAGSWTIQAAGNVTIQASRINLQGSLNVDGDISATGTIVDAGGNTNHHSH
jgi:hypothetical protein